ncbi:MAG: IS66 family transposase [bacterium]|nr:MAG: IS66 family transposase [bacterium]
MITIMGKNIIGDFSAEDWANTPESVKKAVFEVNDLYFELLKKNEQLEQNFNKVEGQLKKDSSNSSKPPSSDSPYKKRYASNKNKTARQGKAGAKKGHQGHRQKLMEPTQTLPVHPTECPCGCTEFTNEQPFHIHQEIELPEIKMDITHFVLFQGECTDCGNIIKATVPKEHQTGYGPRLSAFIGEIAGIQGNSRTTVQMVCQSILKFSISLGAIQKVIDRVSAAILPHYQTIAQTARQSLVNGIDETIWKMRGKLMYLWAMVSLKVAFFMMHQHRSKEAFLQLIADWKGILISDGYRLYQDWVNLRQTCLSHLIRDARALSEHPKKDIRQFGEKAMEMLQQLCAMAQNTPDQKQWDEFYTGFIDLIFDNIGRVAKDEAGTFARRLLREIDCLWTFLEVAGVEPTNNRTERAVRFGVLWRKRSQGTRSDKGNRWVERILSLRQTARQQNLPTFEILVDAVSAYFKEQVPDLAWIREDDTP